MATDACYALPRFGTLSYILIRIHLYVFTWMTLASFVSLVTSCRVEPWRFQVILGRGLPVARHSTDTGSPILTRRGPDGVSRALGATELADITDM